MPANSINIKISIRSSLSFVVFSIIAISMTLFILSKIDSALAEIERLSNSPERLFLKKELAE